MEQILDQLIENLVEPLWTQGRRRDCDPRHRTLDCRNDSFARSTDAREAAGGSDHLVVRHEHRLHARDGFVVVAVIQQLGVATTSFVAVIGAAGLAIGLAFQNSLSNFAAGFLLILFRPFKAGDFIEAGGTAGTVEKVEVFTTTLRTGDNRTVIVPNSAIAGGNITNVSTKPTRRVEWIVGIGYDDDLRRAKQILLDLMTADQRVLKDPAAAVFVTDLGESSVNLTARAWVNSADFWNTKCDLTERIKLTLDEQGIHIPYPQRHVHLHTIPAAA